MMRVLLALALVMLAGCPSTTVRRTKVLHGETLVLSQSALQAAQSIKDLIPKGCTCLEGSFTDPVCEAAAKRALVIEARIPRIRDNALHLIGVKEKRPPKDLPKVPETSTLCPPE